MRLLLGCLTRKLTGLLPRWMSSSYKTAEFLNLHNECSRNMTVCPGKIISEACSPFLSGGLHFPCISVLVYSAYGYEVLIMRLVQCETEDHPQNTQVNWVIMIARPGRRMTAVSLILTLGRTRKRRRPPHTALESLGEVWYCHGRIWHILHQTGDVVGLNK